MPQGDEVKPSARPRAPVATLLPRSSRNLPKHAAGPMSEPMFDFGCKSRGVNYYCTKIMRVLKLISSTLVLFSSNCGARSAFYLENDSSVWDDSAGGSSFGDHAANGTIVCGLGGTAGVGSTTIGSVSVLSALPICLCPKNSQCEPIGTHNGCWPTPCDAARFGLQHCVNNVHYFPYTNDWCIPGNNYVCWAC